MMTMMKICSTSSFISLTSDKPKDPKLRDKKQIPKKGPAVTARPRQERPQLTTTAAPTVNCTSDNGSALRDDEDR